MALNSDQLQAVYRMSDAGQDNQALSLLAQLHDSAETGEEKAHLLLAESRCLSRLGKVAESQKSLKAVAKLKVSDGATNAASELMSALNFRLLGEHKRALKILTGIPAKYSEVMREHAWFRRDVNAEIAFTKVT